MELVTVFVHQVDTEAHPTIPGGWRWAVHLGLDPHDLDRCVNAGWCPSDTDAELEGEMVGTAVAKALTLATGRRADYRFTRLEIDPIPSGADLVGA